MSDTLAVKRLQSRVDDTSNGKAALCNRMVLFREIAEVSLAYWCNDLDSILGSGVVLKALFFSAARRISAVLLRNALISTLDRMLGNLSFTAGQSLFCMYFLTADINKPVSIQYF